MQSVYQNSILSSLVLILGPKININILIFVNVLRWPWVVLLSVSPQPRLLKVHQRPRKGRERRPLRKRTYAHRISKQIRSPLSFFPAFLFCQTAKVLNLCPLPHLPPNFLLVGSEDMRSNYGICNIECTILIVIAKLTLSARWAEDILTHKKCMCFQYQGNNETQRRALRKKVRSR